MEWRAFVERSQRGDTDAFVQLVRRSQQMAFGYAYTLLGDFQLAEDAAQEAFLTAYYNLDRLREAEAFPGWLRGIVRHHCQHIRRTRRVACVSLEQVEEVASTNALETQVEREEIRRQVLTAVADLPEPLREVIVLYYLREHSQQEVAAFLEIPVSQVNNRLHTARQRLKRRLLPMVEEVLQENALPQTFAERIGSIVRVQGPLVEAQFPLDAVPPLFHAVQVADTLPDQAGVLEVAQHLGNGLTRCVLVSEAAVLTQGMRLTDTGAPLPQPLPDAIARQVTERLGKEETAEPTLMETGIKPIDLLCPFPQRGRVGFFAEWGVGLVVLLSELVHRLKEKECALTLFAFVQETQKSGDWTALREEIVPGTDTLQIVYLPVEDPTAPEFVNQFSTLDSLVCLSRRQAEQRMWPAIDPIYSTSRLLESQAVSKEHVRLAQEIRTLLRQYYERTFSLDTPGRSALTPKERNEMQRARKVQRFLTQPFFVAEPFTQTPGHVVSLSETLDGINRLLSGEADTHKADAFYMIGAYADAQARATT